MLKQIIHNRGLSFFALLLVILASPATALSVEAAASSDASRTHWQPVSEAQVKVDDKTPLTWSVYEPDKKSKKNSLVLILLGHRYVLLDIKAKLVYEVSLSQIHMLGKEIDTEDLPEVARPIPCSDWTSRDVGPAELIQITLGDYGRMLTLALPHTPDIRLGIY